MSPREYNSDEVAAIFERASETERGAAPQPTDGKGLTLAALQGIGKEVGISPESIALAAQSLDHVVQPASATFMGLPIAVGRTVDIDRPLTEADWEQLVADLRTTFNARGVMRHDGRFRQWTNGNLQALVEPTATGYRVRLESMKGDARAMMTAGAMVLGGASAALISVALAGSLHNPGITTGIGFMTLMGLGMFSAGALRVSGWARRRRAQFEDVAARLMKATRTSD